MKTFHLPDGRDGLIVEVPNDVIKIDLKPHPIGNDNWLWWKLNTNITGIPLPPGNWSILADTDSMSEEVAATLVQSFGQYNYRDYTGFLALHTALESFASLLRSLGLDPANRYIILVKG